MTRRRWIADEVTGDTAALVGNHAAHLARVLRAQIGDEFDVATGSDVYRGTITTISNDRVEFLLDNLRRGLPKPATNSDPKITLVLAVFKFDRMEWAIEKCTEIGVARIVPVIARRTDAHLATAALKRHERWQRIARQASEQSRRSAPPEITAPVKLKELAVTDLLPIDLQPRVVFSESLAGAEAASCAEILRSQSSTGAVALAIGPEGGWAEAELVWFHDTGWRAGSLGLTILRSETAAIVATTLALEFFRS
jgi:16S rRNA (uracil1498-N3)-methyltransferase